MLGMGKLARKVFGTPNDRKIKATRPLIAQINALEPEYEALDDAALIAKTEEFRKRFAEGESLDALLPVLNAKTRRTGICGAAECLLIHREAMDTIGQGVIRALLDAGVEVRGDAGVQQVEGVTPATEGDWGREYLDKIIAAKVVADEDDAIAHIRRYGSQHTDCILSQDEAAVEKFIQRVDSAIVMVNSSTQFADGGEFGMGAEIGIATGKMHARGPVGAEQLTSFKYVVRSDGAVRG